MKVVVIGGGPTGLGAAWSLQESGADWTLLERDTLPGGLSASFLDSGFTWDIGGHILFSHYDEYDRALDSVMPASAWNRHQRAAFIRMHENWVPYPFQYNIHHLPDEESERCLRGVEAVSREMAAGKPANFREWIYRTMGAGLADLFMIPYNGKVWAGDPSGMATQWMGERVAVPDAERMRKCLRDRTDEASWGPNNAFRFPVSGGTGAIWQAIAAHLPQERIRYKARVAVIDTAAGTVSTAEGRVFPYDALISTMPLDQMTSLAGMAEEAAACQGLIRTSTWVGGVGMEGEPPAAVQGKCWMYFPEPEYPFYRVTAFSRYSRRNAPPGHYSLMAEVSFRPGDARPDDAQLMSDCVAGLRCCGLIADSKLPVHTWRYVADYGYPVPSLGRDAILDRVLPALETRQIYSRGRFGAWKYEVGNMDHSFMQGVEAARRIMDGTPEETVWYPDRVNNRRKS